MQRDSADLCVTVEGRTYTARLATQTKGLGVLLSDSMSSWKAMMHRKKHNTISSRTRAFTCVNLYPGGRNLHAMQKWFNHRFCMGRAAGHGPKA